MRDCGAPSFSYGPRHFHAEIRGTGETHDGVQVEWQTKTLENIQTALRDARPSRTASPAADGVEADVIDVEAVQEAEGRGRSQVKISDFMRDNWRDDWAAVKIKSYLLKYSLLLKTRVTQIAGRFCEL